MNRKFVSSLLAICGLLIAAGYAQTAPPTQKNTVVEEIVARVNSAIITRNDLAKSREQLAQEVRERGGANVDEELAKREKDLLRDAIDQQLLLQKAQDLGITGDTELIKRLDEIRKSMNLESMEDLEKAAQAQGVSYEDFKQNLKNNIITQAVIGREVGSRIQITPEEEKQFYGEHKSELERPEQVRLGEILIAPKPAQAQPADKKDASPADPTPEEIAAAQRAAEAALAEIKNGAKFEEVAKKVSGGPTAAEGGDLGYFRRGTLAKELEDLTFNMKPGEVSNVIRTKQGFVILKVTEHQQAGIPAMKDVEADVQQAIYLKKLQPALRAYLTKLREEAYIDIRQGYVDSAASPNETKPVYVASSSDSGEKAKPKKKKKFLIF